MAGNDRALEQIERLKKALFRHVRRVENESAHADISRISVLPKSVSGPGLPVPPL